ncbi:MAG TPA: large conductance mechanosensitive channel protein MscL [Bacilli bacterium]|nr:large conductance mechanosensitive channel protein MscL [Bacilli bacterium]
MLKEFKEFALRGNLVDMTVGVVIGTAFSSIAKSIVNDIIMPPMGLLLGRVDFSSLYINLSSKKYATFAEAQKAGAPTINYGQFVNQVLSFLIVAIVMFFVVRQINRLRRQKEKEPEKVTTKDCPFCLSSIPLQATRCGHCTSILTTEA